MTAILSASNVVRSTDILVTSELFRRPDRPVQLQAELDAFRELAGLMSFDPHAAVRRFLEIALALCNAGTAGVSILRTDASGAAAFHWDTLVGALASHEGGTTPRNSSPCGLCLDSAGPILVSRPARVFKYFEAAEPAIVEGLVVPLYDNARHALGTLWVVHHDTSRQFVPNDVRVLEQLASQLVLALKLIEERKRHGAAQAQIAESERQRRQTASELAIERERRRRAENSESGLWEVVSAKDALIQEINHRVKNTIQATMSLLSLQARTTQSAEAREVLREAQGRLQLLGKVHELLYQGADNAQEVPIATLLGSLAATLERSFADMQGRVRLSLEVEEAMLHPDHAIPIALLTNEAVTNAYKHAFPGSRSGQVSIRLARTASSAFLLEIHDDGIGLPADTREGSLGLKLIKTFAAQLKGTLAIDGQSAGGTAVRLTVCVPEPSVHAKR